MNEYFKNLKKIEFLVTLNCTGKCKHCQNGDPVRDSEHIKAEAAVDVVRKICEQYSIETVLTFGGEPLLHPDVVCAVQSTARAMNVPKRQVITNGFFSKNKEKIEEVVQMLASSGVNDLLLSVDAFHQETIPLEPVLCFAESCVKAGLPIELSPAWLVSPEDHDPYNDQTRKILQAFEPWKIPTGIGNVIFPSGNALKYLREYFDDVSPSSPYEDDPRDIRAISFSPNGDVLNGNIYQTDILEIIRSYRP